MPFEHKRKIAEVKSYQVTNEDGSIKKIFKTRVELAGFLKVADSYISHVINRKKPINGFYIREVY